MKTAIHLVSWVLCTLLCGTRKAAALSSDPRTFFGAASSSNLTSNDNNQAYHEWIQQYGDNYERVKFLAGVVPDEEGREQGVALHWSITNRELHIAVIAKAVGWVGFGISENGGMKGADIVIFAANKLQSFT